VINDETTESLRSLTDGRNYVWGHVNDDGFIDRFNRYERNAPDKILNAVAAAFDTQFDTEEEWETLNDYQKHEDQFYHELLKFLNGEVYDIQPKEMYRAKIAKTLVDHDRSLYRDKLLSEVLLIYKRMTTFFANATTAGPRSIRRS
jgi:hypothetical protein